MAALHCGACWRAPATAGHRATRTGSPRQSAASAICEVAPHTRRAEAAAHIITPETQTSSHYFYDHEPGDEAWRRAMQVFTQEDEPMIEAEEQP